ncbi:peroxisome biogenesis factor 2-like [Gigantopelta aegis]|uniref:peroxisome biogenesis factor 2-like n=1 Tax=Gigantopelta aegis TaxID=1735272 RepID=UPI001B88BBFB|nr:peroxisome biogenesis factor 2-like [Gigantopelta aegis]
MAKEAEGRVSAVRVSQLDSHELDQESFQLMKTQLNKVFKYHQSNFLTKFDPEVTAALKLILWKFSVFATGTTIGQRILNIRYGNTHGSASSLWIGPYKKILYAALLIGCPWLKERSGDLIRLTKLTVWRDVIEKALRWTESGLKVAALLNFLLFLRHGGYQLIVERLLGIQSMHSERQRLRQLGFEYLTRELLWHGFSEFLLFILPLVNVQQMKNVFLRWTVGRSHQAPVLSQRSAVDLTTCAVCGDWPVTPQHIGCPHVFCYYCIQSNFKCDSSFVCPQCGHGIPGPGTIDRVLVTLNTSR